MTNKESKVATWLAKLPAVDRPNKESTLTGPTWDQALEIINGILADGRECLVELVDRVQNGFGGDSEHDYRPGYALRCIALYAGAPGNEAIRELFVEAVASRLGGSQPKAAQAFLMRELQLAGGAKAATLGKLLVDEELCETATQALATLDGGGAAELIAAWPAATGKCRLAIAQALGDTGTSGAAPLLRSALGDTDRDLRLTAARALARLGDATCAEALLRLAQGASGWERGQAMKACLLLAEALLAAGKKEEARRVYENLRSQHDPADAHVRDAAERGLAATAR